MSPATVSVVIPTYKVARYLPDFLGSLDRQIAGLEGFELIFVDDGSPDDSAEIVRAWMTRATVNAQIAAKANGGLCSARNAGLEVATGDWVTFWDPDDMLDARYTAETLPFLRSSAADDVDLVVGRLVFYEESSGSYADHPLDYRFRAGNRVVDLERRPSHIHLAANTGFYRRDRLESHALRFDPEVKPSFEDANLTGRYLGKVERPRIAVRANARYLYRKRADNSSLVQSGWRDGEKFVNQPGGWLSLLKGVHADRGHVPRWAQYMVMYDLHWYFLNEWRKVSLTAWVPPDLARRFHGVLTEVAQYLEPDLVEGFGSPPGSLPPDLVNAMLIGVQGIRQRPAHVTLDHVDTSRRLVRMRYYYGGALPEETFRARGSIVRPVHAKSRAIDLLGKTLARERIVYFCATDSLSVSLDGTAVPVDIGPVRNDRHTAGPSSYWRRLAETDPPAPGRQPRPGRKHRIRAAGAGVLGGARSSRAWAQLGEDAHRRVTDGIDAAMRGAAKGGGGRLFGGAWLLMDHGTHAQGNAEHLYRYLAASRPKVNAWYVLDRDSADWARLQRDGFKLVAYGSRKHVAAALHARHLVSSQLDRPVVPPEERRRLGDGHWKVTFLRQDVSQGDMATWLNARTVSLVLTTTPEEHESIVGDDTRYRHTSAEAVLAGLPRHDALLRKARTIRAEECRTVLVAPARRMWRRPDIWGTGYAQAWCDLVTSPDLQEQAGAAGYEIVLLLPADLGDQVGASPLPREVKVLSPGDNALQDLLPGVALLVTDYSSLAFDAAYLNRPTVYHQFDEDAVRFGSHAYRRGYWDYAEHGFGPVCDDQESTLAAVVKLLNDGCVPAPEYVQRMGRTFPHRDGKVCERAYQAIRALDEPVGRESLYAEPASGVVVEVRSETAERHGGGTGAGPGLICGEA